MPTSTVLASRLDRLQVFKEVAWGTGAAATAILMGVKPRPEIKPWKKNNPIEEQRGSLAPGYTHYQEKDGGDFKIDMTATYEEILYALSAALGVVSPTGVGPYVWAWAAAPAGAAWNAQSYTLEWGYSAAQSKIVNGCLTQKFSVKGELQKPWECSMEGFFKTYTSTGTMTGALTNRTVEAILMANTLCYIDATGGTIGTTAQADSLLSFSLEWDTGLKPVFAGGSLAPVNFVYERIMPTLSLSLLYNATTKTAIDSMEAGTRQLIRIKATSGTKIAQFDFAGFLSDDPTYWPDKDGAKSVEVKLTSEYDSGFASYLASSVTNGVAALP